MGREVTRDVVESNLIFLAEVGSHAYGTNLPESDTDEGGICIVPFREYYYGEKNFEQFTDFKNDAGEKIDKSIYSLKKIVALVLDNNPNMLDYLGLPERCVKFIRPEWEIFRTNIDKILCSKSKHTFSGYAFSQIKRLEAHRGYLLNPMIKKPERKDFGLEDVSIFPEAQMESIAKISTNFVTPVRQGEFYNKAEKILLDEFYLLYCEYMESKSMITLAINDFRKDQMSFLRFLCSIGDTYLKDEYREAARKELQYRMAKDDWNRYTEWKKTRNPKRFEMEKKCGYDSKFASHALRLCRMGREILQGKGLRVDRTNIDRDELVDIRLGNWKFENVMNLVNQERDSIEELYKTTTIRKSPDREFVSNLLVEVTEKYLDQHR